MKHKLLFASLLALFVSLAAYPVFAAATAQEIVTLNIVQVMIDVGAVLATLAGVTSLISVIVNFLKYFKLITEGTGGQMYAILNLLAFVALVSARIFAPQYSIEYLDGAAGQLALAGTLLSAYIFQLGIGQVTYGILKRLKVVGALGSLPVRRHSA